MCFHLVIDGGPVVAERHLLRQRELCFLFGASLREIRRRVRRGEIVTAGSGRIDVEAVARLLEADEDLLALEFLRGWSEGAFEMPQPATPDEPPPSQESRLELLRRKGPGREQGRYRT